MHRIILSVAVLLLLSLPVSAMPIKDFAKMNLDDEATYTALLVQGVADMFKQQGKPDLAARTTALFHDTGKDGGVNQLAVNLRAMATENVRDTDNPNNRVPPRTFEDALARTLNHAGIDVPVSYLRSLGRDFRPTGPPRARVPSAPSP